MTHPRSQIRDAVKTRLAGAEPRTEAGDRVHVNRTTPLFAKALPAILVYARDERVDGTPDGPGGPTRRVLDLAIEIVAEGEHADAQVDRIAAEVETAFEEDDTLERLVESMRLLRTDIDVDGDGDTPIVVARLGYEVVYWTVREADEEAVAPTDVRLKIYSPFGPPVEPEYHSLTSLMLQT
jgi:hypothetical protein